MQRRAHLERRQVLIAEDDRDMRALLAQSLRRLGVEVIEAGDGEQLLATLRQLEGSAEAHMPDLVVTDVHMPKMGGLEALEALHAQYPELPVVVISAHLDRTSAGRAIRLGAAAVLDKPLEVPAFRDIIVNLLGY